MTKISDQHLAKQQKLRSILHHSIDPYPARVARTHTASQVIFEFNQLENKTITIVGRVRSVRLHGGSCFAHLEDGTDRMQIFLKRDEMKNEDYAFFTDLVDIGDFIEATGSLFTTKKGEKTLLVKKFRLISKSLAPLPEKWHGLSDIEIRYRQRYLDLMSNPEVKAIFQKRGLIIKTIR
jgi:lysyl-tRNA synthetase class 2